MFCILVVPELLWFRQSLNCKLSGIKMILVWIKDTCFYGRYLLSHFYWLLVAILLLAFLWALSIGTVKLPLAQIYTVIVDQLQSDLSVEAAGRGAAHDIVWLLRLPRLVLAAAVGCGLACCGVIMQAIVKNPLADPYILGISS